MIPIGFEPFSQSGGLKRYCRGFFKTSVFEKATLDFTVILSAVFVLNLTACSVIPGGGGKMAAGGTPGLFSAMVWNVQTLFDGTDAGTEYDDYRSPAGWTEEKYAARLLSISLALESITGAEDEKTFGNPKQKSPGLPDLIGLVEIENLQVLEDLAGGPLSKYGYNRVVFGHLPGAPLGIGVLSRLPLSETRVHSITAYGETAPRPILELHLEAQGEGLIFFLCHWKSKLGGDKATEPLRRASARVINRRLAEIRQEDPRIPLIIMGDLNENHDEFYRLEGTAICTLLPDDPEAAECAVPAETAGDFLVLTHEKPPTARFFNSRNRAFYSPWGNELPGGSYFYRNDWETIDHFLLDAGLFDNQGWEFEDCRVLGRKPFTGTKGYPVPYTPRNGSGLSDHLPLLLYLRKAIVPPAK